jgi:hypothetical protein
MRLLSRVEIARRFGARRRNVPLLLRNYPVQSHLPSETGVKRNRGQCALSDGGERLESPTWPQFHLSTPIPQHSPLTEILPAWTSSDPAPTKFHSAGTSGYSTWMSGYPAGNIRHSTPTEMPSTGMSRCTASIEIQSAGTFRYSAGICGYSTSTEFQSTPIRRLFNHPGQSHFPSTIPWLDYCDRTRRHTTSPCAPSAAPLDGLATR